MSKKLNQTFSIVITPCPHCNEEHHHDIPIDLLNQELNTLNFACPNVTRMLRLTDFYFDFTANYESMPKGLGMEKDILERIKSTYGEEEVEDKFLRWKEISRANIWLMDEYDVFLEEITKAYIQGLYYTAITGACCLTERVLNRLVIKLKGHFKQSEHYKKIYNKEQKLQSWDFLIDVLRDWNILNDSQIKICKKLHRYRNDSVHYIPEYDFKANAPKAIKLAIELIDSLFSVFARKDIFYTFVIPGEIWVKSSMEKSPFVKEFVEPHCRSVGAVSQLEKDGYLEDGAIVGQLSEEEFIKTRTDYNRNPDNYRNGKTPVLMKFEFEGKQKFIRLI